MSDILDSRLKPKGVLPKNAQVWLMGGLALAIMVIIAFTSGTATPKPLTQPAQQTTALSPERLKEYQTRLNTMNEQAKLQQQQAAIASQLPAELPRNTSAAASSQPVDPLIEERRKKDYDSLFSSNVVSKRGATTPIDRARPTSIDEITESVIRASQRGAAPSVSLPPPAAPNVAPASQQTPRTDVPERRGQIASWEGKAAPRPIDDSGLTHRLLRGSVIDGVLQYELNGSSASPVVVLVSEPRYSHSGNIIVIPAGSRILGEAKAVQNYGESRLAVGFDTLQYPDGSSISLEHAIGVHQSGAVGLKDKTDNHLLSIFGKAAIYGLIQGGSQAIGNSGFGGGNRTTVMIGGASNTMGQSASGFMSHAPLPTIRIRPGQRVKIFLNQDIELQAYGARS